MKRHVRWMWPCLRFATCTDRTMKTIASMPQNRYPCQAFTRQYKTLLFTKKQSRLPEALILKVRSHAFHRLSQCTASPPAGMGLHGFWQAKCQVSEPPSCTERTQIWVKTFTWASYAHMVVIIICTKVPGMYVAYADKLCTSSDVLAIFPYVLLSWRLLSAIFSETWAGSNSPSL